MDGIIGGKDFEIVVHGKDVFILGGALDADGNGAVHTADDLMSIELTAEASRKRVPHDDDAPF